MVHSLLDNINYVWYYEWPPRHTAFTLSPEGHTLQYLASGGYSLELKSTDYSVREGDIVYYSSLEPHRYTGSGEFVAMYSINFSAPGLFTLDPGERVIHDSEEMAEDFRTIYEAFHSPEDTLKSLEAFYSLSKILQKVYSVKTKTSSLREGYRWRKIETFIKTEHKFKIKPAELSSMFSLSSSSLYRICKKTTGKSPGKQIREIRMNEALNLLKYTGMNISEIASYLNYSRVHEFSRDFSSFTGMSPTEYLKTELLQVMRV